MWYLLDKDNNCMGTCSSKPNLEDLKNFNMTAVESDLVIDLNLVQYSNGVISKRDLTKEEKITELTAYYNAQLSSLASQWNIANMDGDTYTMDSIKKQREELKAKYESDKLAIENS